MMTFPSSSISPAMLLPSGSIWLEAGANLKHLVRAIAQHFGACWDKAEAAPLGLSLVRRHVVLLLVDGLGDDYLTTHSSGFLTSRRLGALSSVFPSTTASAIATVMTGLAPIQHGLLGWFVRERRLGGILAPLPMTLRTGGEVRGALRLRQLFPYRTLFQRMPCRSTVVSPRGILASAFNRRHSRGASRLGYQRLEGLVTAVREAVLGHGSEGGYVYAYYPRFDSLAHSFGVKSDRVAEEFVGIEAAIVALADSLTGLGVDLIVTADHGFIDIPPGQTLEIGAWPEIPPMLETFLWGERRAAWCAVRMGAASDFEAAMSERLGMAGRVLPSAGLPGSGLLGAGRPSARLAERMGTHLIAMAPDWAVRDHVPGEAEHPMIGLHGGLSVAEMRIPLIHIRCG